LSHHFRGAGYTTGYIGKWHLADEEPVTEPRRGGYEYWMGTDCLEFTSDAYEAYLYNNDNERVKLPGYRVDALTDVAIRYIDEHQEEPFFLFISYIEPHHQNHNDSYPAPDGYREKYTSKWMPPDLAALGLSDHGNHFRTRNKEYKHSPHESSVRVLLRRMEEAGESRPEIVEAPRKMKKERYAHQIK
jgi:arylsulfatase A-like enzyme